MGSSHIRGGLPNQDDINWYPVNSDNLPKMLAIADGHGSKKSFRSHKGSEFAVKTAIDTCREFVDSLETGTNVSQIKEMAFEQLPREILRRWKAAVNEDIDHHPFSEDEQSMVGENLNQAYGATLLTVIVSEGFIVYVQIGDGDILTVEETGQVNRPIPPDERLIANETTSLCTPHAWKDFRVRFQKILDTPPELIMLSTDGYANSFKDEASFVKVAADIHQMMQTEGPDYVKENLESWLNEASEAGSGDDITVGIVYREKNRKKTENVRHPS